MKKIGVIGLGSYGTALAITAARAGNEVLCWARRQEVVDMVNLQHINKKYLSEIPLPDAIRATNDISEVFSFANVVLITVSAQAVRGVLQQIKPFVQKETILVLCAKGIEKTTGKMMSEVAEEILPNTTIAILSGPGFAVDIAQRKLTSVTIACIQGNIATLLTEQLATPYFRPYTTTDIIAPQIGGSVKNVIAIASGIIEGASFGDGARAALITRGLNEMVRLSKALGGTVSTLMGMSGLGDLVLTANCSQSRNFSFGYEIGVSGCVQKHIKENTRTVEGLYTVQAVTHLAHQHNLEMPICEMVDKILFSGISLHQAVEELMGRPYKEEGF